MPGSVRDVVNRRGVPGAGPPARAPGQVGQAGHERLGRAECIRRLRPLDQDPDHSRAVRPADGGCRQHSCWSTAVRRVYHHETKNLLVSYSPKKLGFFWSLKSVAWRHRCAPGNPTRPPRNVTVWIVLVTPRRSVAFHPDQSRTNWHRRTSPREPPDHERSDPANTRRQRPNLPTPSSPPAGRPSPTSRALPYDRHLPPHPPGGALNPVATAPSSSDELPAVRCGPALRGACSAS